MNEDKYERWLEQHEQRLRMLGVQDPVCSHPDCDERDPFALTGAAPDILCYEHRAKAEGRSWLEGQHVPGRHNDEQTDLIPGNDHRAWDAMKRSWPEETLHNPNKSPLIRASAHLRGFLDLLWQLVVRILGWIPGLLEQLDAWLIERLGASWWEAFIRDTGWEA